MALPALSADVRFDSGFIAGDEVSAHYDPMIAKLIVRGRTRALAINKLHSALGELEIAGLITNVEFLRDVCKNTIFMSGKVGTDFITKQKDTLLAKTPIDPEIYIQAALSSLLTETATQGGHNNSSKAFQPGWHSAGQSCDFELIPIFGDGKTDTKGTRVNVRQLRAGLFDVSVHGVDYHSITCAYDSHTRTLTSFLPQTRLETRVIQSNGSLTLFHQGQQYRMEHATPKWVQKALGIKDDSHSILTPMPCKILRVDAQVGDSVKKNQTLVVIESMKMETVIKSPQDGVISRVVHQQGVSCTVDEQSP